MAVLLNWSRAATVTEKAVPAVAVTGAVTVKCVAAAGLTVMAFVVPVIELVAVSVAVMVWLPAVFSVAEKVPVPAVSVLLAGSEAAASLLVKCTVPP